MKWCSKCALNLPSAEFSRNKAKKDGVNSWCRPCMREYQDLRKEAKAESDREYARQYRRTNRGKIQAYKRGLRAKAHNTEGKHTEQEVYHMIVDQGGLCAYCEAPLDDFHVEHMTPSSRGGRNDWTNLAIACPECNLRKGTKTAEEFMTTLLAAPTS